MTAIILVATVVVSLIAFVVPPVYSSLGYYAAASYAHPWRWVSVALVHGGLIHLALNMLALWMVGPTVERVFGKWRFLALYLFATIGGSLGVFISAVTGVMSGFAYTVGASGGIFGLFAAIYVIQRRFGIDTRAITVLLVVNLAYGFMVSGVSWQAHLGGMIVGAIAAWILLTTMEPKPGRTAQRIAVESVMACVAIAAVLALIIIGLPSLFALTG